MNTTPQPVVRPQLLIRVPVAQAFQAFVDPAVTTKFWFTDSDGPLETGRDLCWQWRMYGASAPVHVIELETNKRIVVSWGDNGNQSTVEWTFDPRPDETTMVTIANYGFTGTPVEVTAKAIDAMGGFTTVLAGAKAFLEHGIELNLVRDHAPDAHVAEHQQDQG